MFPNYPAQGFGQQYSFEYNNGYYLNLPKRPCVSFYPGQYSFLPYAAQFYPQNYGYPEQTTNEIEVRKRKIVKVIPVTHERPIWTFTGLALLALMNSEDKTATTDEIYKFVLDNFPFFEEQAYASWTGAIRHNLAKKKILFSRVTVAGQRCGKWTICSEEKTKKEIMKEIKKSKKEKECGMRNPDNFDALIGRFLTSPTVSEYSVASNECNSESLDSISEVATKDSDQVSSRLSSLNKETTVTLASSVQDPVIEESSQEMNDFLTTMCKDLF